VLIAPAERSGAVVVRGSETDVLSRYAKAAAIVGATTVVRVTSDCPLIDPQVCGAVLQLRASKQADYASNNLELSFPHGLDCEVFTASALAEAAVKAALRLRPDSAEAHFALADFLFRCHRDYDGALKELAIARPGLPNDTAFFILSGYINRRRNNWRQAERDFSTAVALDPRNPNAYNLLADTYNLQRRHLLAAEVYDRVLAAGERTPIVFFRRDSAIFNGTGNSTGLHRVLSENPDMDIGGGQTPIRVFLALIDGNFAEAERVLAASPREDFQDVDYSFYYPKAWFEALIARAKGDSAAATAAFSAARAILEQRLAVKPEHARTLAVLAQVDAGLGHKELAIQEAQHAFDLMPVSKDIYDGALVLEGLAQVYTWINEPDRAIEVLQKLVTMPGYTYYARLKLYPMWNPLRGDPRFEKIVNSLAPKDQGKQTLAK